MKRTSVLIFLVSVILPGYLINAASLSHKVINTSIYKSMIKNPSSKTEIFIDNDSNDTVWVSAATNSKKSLWPKFSLRLYNDDIEMSYMHIVISKNIVSEIFFDEMVSNHTVIKVKEHLAKPVF